MPRSLVDRCQLDSIREFRASAARRFEDGLSLAMTGRRTAAIYLWGYSAEMVLKAAYFSLIGLGDTAVITMQREIRPAIGAGRQMGIAWPNRGEGHNVQAWAELLVAERAASAAGPYPTPLRLQVQRCAQRIYRTWRETLRYHKNLAYPHEVRQVRESAEWLLVHSQEL